MTAIHTAAAVLAGGASNRFGADKAMARLRDEPLIAHVARALRTNADALAVVGNDTAAQVLGATGLSDPIGSPGGPLAGLLAALDWAHSQRARWLVTAPCDVPLLSPTLGRELIDAAEKAGAPAALSRTQRGLHPLCAAWRPSLAAQLRERLAQGTHPAVRDFAPDAVLVAFANEDSFLNVNTPADLVRAAALIAER